MVQRAKQPHIRYCDLLWFTKIPDNSRPKELSLWQSIMKIMISGKIDKNEVKMLQDRLDGIEMGLWEEKIESTVANDLEIFHAYYRGAPATLYDREQTAGVQLRGAETNMVVAPITPDDLDKKKEILLDQILIPPEDIPNLHNELEKRRIDALEGLPHCQLIHSVLADELYKSQHGKTTELHIESRKYQGLNYPIPVFLTASLKNWRNTEFIQSFGLQAKGRSNSQDKQAHQGKILTALLSIIVANNRRYLKDGNAVNIDRLVNFILEKAKAEGIEMPQKTTIKNYLSQTKGHDLWSSIIKNNQNY